MFSDGVRQRKRVSDHGAVQAVLRHDAAARPTPRLFRLAPLGPPVLEPDLRSQRNQLIYLLLIRTVMWSETVGLRIRPV